MLRSFGMERACSCDDVIIISLIIIISLWSRCVVFYTAGAWPVQTVWPVSDLYRPQKIRQQVRG